MSVKCLECGQNFNHLSWSHLKYKHGMNISEYREKYDFYGSLYPEASEMCRRRNLKNNPSYREDVKTKKSKKHRDWWRSLSDEYKENMNIKMRNGQKRFFNTLTPERRLERSMKTTDGLKKYLKTLSDEELVYRADIARKNICSQSKDKIRDTVIASNHRRKGKQKPALSISLKKWWYLLSIEQREEVQKRRMTAVIRRPTRPEKAMMELLNKHFPGEWKYVGDGAVWMGGRNPDFININGKKMMIEVFGRYWHEEKDIEIRCNHFKKYGFKCIVFWEDEVTEDILMRRLFHCSQVYDESGVR